MVGPLGELARGPAQRFPPPVATVLQQQHLARPTTGAGDAHARGQHPGAVDHDQVAGLEVGRKVADPSVFGPGGAAARNHEPCGIARFDRNLRHQLFGEFVVEFLDPHGCFSLPARTGIPLHPQNPMERPMISFMISVVPP